MERIFPRSGDAHVYARVCGACKSRAQAEDDGHTANGARRALDGESVVGMACQRPPEKRWGGEEDSMIVHGPVYLMTQAEGAAQAGAAAKRTHSMYRTAYIDAEERRARECVHVTRHAYARHTAVGGERLK